MVRKGENQLRVGHESPQQRCFMTSWVRTSGSNLYNIPQIKWTCPPQFMMDPNWKIEAGSESKETLVQLQRESRTAVAIYHRNFDIPDNPSVASDALDFYSDDNIVPIVPLDIISDETSLDDGIPLITPSPNVKVGETTTPPPLNIHPRGPRVDGRAEVGTQPLLQRDEVVGMAVALVALIKSKEPGNQIDLELLIQLLRNPGMLEQMMKEHGLSATQRSIITSAQNQEISRFPLPVSRQPLEVRPPKSELSSFVTRSTPISVPGPRLPENLTKVPVCAHTTSSSSALFTHSMTQELKGTIESQTSKSIPVARVTSAPSAGFSKFEVGKSELNSFVTQTTRISVPGPVFTENLTKVPVGVHTTWSPSVPFAHSMSQEVKVTIDGILTKSESQINKSIQVARETSVRSPGFSKFDVGKVRKLINDYGVPPGAGSLSPPSAARTGPFLIKDSDYYRRHTLQPWNTQENPEPRGPVPPVEQRPCVYFNSPRGCMRGPSCWFQHVRVNLGGGSRIMEEQTAKRMKLTGGSFARYT